MDNNPYFTKSYALGKEFCKAMETMKEKDIASRDFNRDLIKNTLDKKGGVKSFTMYDAYKAENVLDTYNKISSGNTKELDINELDNDKYGDIINTDKYYKYDTPLTRKLKVLYM